MKNSFTKTWMLATCMFSSAVAWAQTTSGAQLKAYTMSDGSTFRAMSDNGKWAVAYGSNDATSQDAFPKFINLTTGEITNLADETGAIVSNASDITDDGKMVVGSYQGEPAYFNVQTKSWTVLPFYEGCNTGRVNAVTPDGKYAVGTCGLSSDWLYERPTMWDLTSGKTIALKNIPEADLSGTYQNMTRLTGVSADGRYVTGCISFSYPQDIVYFLYDRQTDTFNPIVFDYNAETKKYTQKNDNVYGLDGICVSPNGKWVSGVLYTMADERAPFRYNTETKEMEYYLDGEDIDKGCVSIDNEGTVYAATPAVNPSRSLYIRHNGYWYGLDEVLKQGYGINYYTHTGYDATGLAIAVSADCKQMVSIAYISQENYNLTLPETFGKACERVNLLNQYTISPLNGAGMSKISNVTLTFSRKVDVLGAKDAIILKDGSGNVVRNSLKFAVNESNSKIVTIGFRTTDLEAGQDYTLTIPAGTISLAGDKARTNEEIVISYKGYGTKALTMTAVSPVGGSTLGQIDLTTSPVVFSFDTEVAVADGAKAYLYNTKDAVPICELNILAGKTSETYKQVMVYPTATQMLYKGNQYKVVLEAGSVTDLSGTSKNEECSVIFEGVYERTIQSDDENVFIENFSSGMDNVMLYDGDGKDPHSDMSEWGFTNAVSWIHGADDDYTNTCAISHSKYKLAATSDDWMSTPQLTIPDKNTILTFKGQSYLTLKTDILKVYVYATDEEFNNLNADAVAKFKSNADLVFEEQLTPGASENILAGDWTDYRVDLAKYAGKKVYIAFVNNNRNQSAIFVTDIHVRRNIDARIALKGVETSYVNGTSQKVKGTVTIANELNTYSTVKLQLLDDQGKVLEEKSANGLSLKKDDTYDFDFAKEISLTTGKNNKFSVKVILNEGMETEGSYEMSMAIKNLSFQTTRRILLEEETGQGCNNCPLGHLAMEKLESLYGDKFIPVAYHTYTGDTYESGMTAYTQGYLGLNAAPTAVINRYAGAYSPMISETKEGVTSYVFTSEEQTLWLERVAYIMSLPTDADINISASYAPTTDKVTIPFDVRFAIDKENANISVFCIITEDNLLGYQSNKFYKDIDPNLGEWQSGGTYGKEAVYPYYFMDVARALYPADNYFGKTGLLPQNISHGETVKGELSFTLKDNAPYVTDINNCKATILLVDASTGELINTARAKISTPTSIGGVEADVEENGSSTATYNIAGQAVDYNYNGFVIMKQGKSTKKVVR